MLIKTKELTGVSLNYAVALANHEIYQSVDGLSNKPLMHNYTDNWELAGLIIEKAEITIVRCDDNYGVDSKGYCNNKRIPVWAATIGQHGVQTTPDYQGYDCMYIIYVEEVVYGETALIAAMRCFVLDQIGASVDIPEKYLINSISVL